MFNSIRRAIAKFIAPAPGTINATPAQLAKAQTLTIPSNIGTQRARSVIPSQSAEMKNGKFYPEHLELLSSQYLRDAIAGLGAWSSLAKMFNEYAKMQNRRNADPSKYEQAKEEFHIWNAATSIDKQMSEESVIIALDKIAEVNIPRGNKDTDAIIARVLNKDIATVQADRIKKATKQTTERKAMLAHLCADVWQYSGEEVECFLSSAKVASKGIQTLEFIATYWQGRPEAIAAELLLIEDDMKVIESLAKQETNHQGDGVSEVTGDYSKPKYQADPAKELTAAAKLDKIAFEAWQASQQE